VAGSGGTPGGSTTQIQFNSSGAFAGDSDLTWDAATNTLTVGSTSSAWVSLFSDDIHFAGVKLGMLGSQQWFQNVHDGGTLEFKNASDVTKLSLDQSGNVTATGQVSISAPQAIGNVGTGASLGVVYSKTADYQQAAAGVVLDQVVNSGTFSWQGWGGMFQAVHSGAGTSSEIAGSQYRIGVATGTVTSGIALDLLAPFQWVSPFNGTITSLYGLRVSPTGDPTTSMTIGDFYGVHISSPTTQTGVTVSGNNYAIYCPSTSQKSFFGGNVQIGGTLTGVDVLNPTGVTLDRIENLCSEIRIQQTNVVAGTAALTVTGSAMAITTNGTATESNGTPNGHWVNYATAAAANAHGGPSATAYTALTFAPFVARFKIATGSSTDITSSRMWHGLFSAIPSATVDDPGGNCIAVRYSTAAGDTTFKLVTRNGTTATVTALTGSPTVAASTRYTITIDYDGTTARVFINGVFAGSATATLPSGTQACGPASLITSLSASARNFKYGSTVIRF
jgi:hypothetical protein